jgi:esterase/lipase superfamily enzyme
MPDKEIWIRPARDLPEAARIVRWGGYGVPVLLFPSAGGDCEELERQGVIAALATLLDSGRIKLYSVDGTAARRWLAGRDPPETRSRVQNAYDAWIHEQVVPQIRQDCRDESVRIVVAGAAFGAFNAVASLCRHPDVFQSAIGVSGRYDLWRYLAGSMNQDFYFSSPLHYLPGLGDSAQLATLRSRTVILACGDGPYEEPAESARMEQVLQAKSIPHRLEWWGPRYDHDWNSWRAMFHKYLSEVASPANA